jgi:hypothetical protein
LRRGKVKTEVMIKSRRKKRKNKRWKKSRRRSSLKKKKGNGKENIHLILLKLKTLPFLGQ